MHILIVSHVAPLLRALQTSLERAKHRVVCVDTMESAIKSISANHSLEVIITEWKLPIGTALELQHRSQEIERLADEEHVALPLHFIVLATPRNQGIQSTGRGVVQEIQSFGFTDVYEKPVQHSRLLSRLAEYEQNRSGSRSQRLERPVSQPNPTPLKPIAQSANSARTPELRVDALENLVATLSRAISHHDTTIQLLCDKIGVQPHVLNPQ